VKLGGKFLLLAVAVLAMLAVGEWGRICHLGHCVQEWARPPSGVMVPLGCKLHSKCEFEYGNESHTILVFQSRDFARQTPKVVVIWQGPNHEILTRMAVETTRPIFTSAVIEGPNRCQLELVFFNNEEMVITSSRHWDLIGRDFVPIKLPPRSYSPEPAVS